MSKHEIDDAAYEALKAHPVMVEEAMTNQDGAFWAVIAKMISEGSYEVAGVYIKSRTEAYIARTIEDFASDEEIRANEAIHKLLNRCNGGK